PAPREARDGDGRRDVPQRRPRADRAAGGRGVPAGGRPMRSRGVVLGALVVAGLLGGASAGARGGEPLGEQARRRVEESFAIGRLDDLDVLLASATEAVDRLPLALRDLYWRPSPAARGEAGEGGTE